MSQSDFSLMMTAITPVIGLIILVVVGRLCIFLFKRYMKQVGDEETDTIADKFDRQSDQTKLNLSFVGVPFIFLCMIIFVLPVFTYIAQGLFFNPVQEYIETVKELIQR